VFRSIARAGRLSEVGAAKQSQAHGNATGADGWRQAVRRFLPGGPRHLLRDLHELKLDRDAQRRLPTLIADLGIAAIYERSALLQAAGLRVAHALGLPHVLEVNSPIEERRDHHGFPLFRVGLARQREKLMLADEIVCVSSPLKRYLIERGAAAEQVHVIPNAVRPERFEISPEERGRVRQAWGLDDSGIAIGFVGRFNEWRGMLPMVRALDQVVRTHPRVHAVLIGDGQLMPQVKQTVAELGATSRITLTGRVDWNQAPRLIASLDIGILSASPWYSSPIKLFEYGASRLCVIAPRVEPVEEVLDGDREGVWFPEGDSDALSGALDSVVRDDERRLGMADRFHARTVTHYTWDRVAATITAIFEGSRRRRTTKEHSPQP
jgi:glycosyltransferase involved in cell wall biosynthesis